MAAAFIVAFVGLYEQRVSRIAPFLNRTAETANTDVSDIFQGAQSLLEGLAEVPLGSECGSRLAQMQRSLAAYEFLAVMDGAGRVLCSSTATLAPLSAANSAWLRPLAGGDGVRVGSVRDPA